MDAHHMLELWVQTQMDFNAVGADVLTCQSLGKKIILSMGGWQDSRDVTGFLSASSAQRFSPAISLSLPSFLTSFLPSVPLSCAALRRGPAFYF